MTFRQAKKKVLLKRLIGVAIAAPSIISTVVSLLKMLYFRLDDGSQLGGILARPVKQFVFWVYANTDSFFGWFWQHSPTPDQIHWAKIENVYFIVIYLLVFVGMAFFASGNKLSRRIEDRVIEESLKGNGGRSREQIEHETNIPSTSIFSQLHQLYLAPIIVGVIVALLVKLVGG